MKMTIEWSKEELEEMICERLGEAGFEPIDEKSIQWKTKPELHIIIHAKASLALLQSPALAAPPRGAPTPAEGFQGDGRLPAEMFPPGADLDALQAAAETEATLAGETRGDPRGSNEDEY